VGESKPLGTTPHELSLPCLSLRHVVYLHVSRLIRFSARVIGLLLLPPLESLPFTGKASCNSVLDTDAKCQLRAHTIVKEPLRLGS
jgi:hypothetical protein